jgi:hypothetical protein
MYKLCIIYKQRFYSILFLSLTMVSNYTYICMTVNGSKNVKIHMFTVNDISTYVVEPIGGGYGDWYELFPSKRFDSLEEAMREVVTLNHQSTFL